jgi:hypothetical protein
MTTDQCHRGGDGDGGEAATGEEIFSEAADRGGDLHRLEGISKYESDPPDGDDRGGDDHRLNIVSMLRWGSATNGGRKYMRKPIPQLR